ncbi:MAG: 50S ribosomal protein L24 [Candidatus Woykebacteria bacterium RBG_13_40_7b]|uniref:Large ribosomal subunit protein uL24 n=1 Tax=Candidatus Woykebacteria bacterium RBG_13_40_7b TaxID=1802594 RepID=A0A1G1W7X5_9BACT|nr:MAG: 50S ribosomal protein L24 [Candidatus Woykebacteria bacterium RBG_13_40_7b]
MKLKVSDEVIVKIGKDKGKKGRIEKSYPKSNKLLVAGVNLYKKHVKKGKKTMQAGIIDIPKPISASNVTLVCPKCNLPTKVGYVFSDNKKLRSCKKCKQTF